MNNDLTILYYTANRITEYFATNVQQNISEASDGAMIISISHKPINFGHNICVAGLEPATYNIYKQILMGAMLAKTPYIGCAEDDSLYTKEHFTYRPPLTAFGYNTNRWQVNSDVYFFRCRASMCMCIAPTELLIQTLCLRFAKFPRFLNREEAVGWGEPGRKEKQLGLSSVELTTFETKTPLLTFNHRQSTGGVRRTLDRDTIRENLPPWGDAKDVWAKVHG